MSESKNCTGMIQKTEVNTSSNFRATEPHWLVIAMLTLRRKVQYLHAHTDSMYEAGPWEFYFNRAHSLSVLRATGRGMYQHVFEWSISTSQAHFSFDCVLPYLPNQLHGPTESNFGNSTVKISTSEMRMPLSSQHYSILHPPCFTVLHPKIFDLDRQKWKFRSRRSYVVGGRSPNT